MGELMTCECCGLHWGGLRTAEPTPKDCPWCAATSGEQVVAMLEKARKDVEHIIKRERAGEHVTAEIMEMRLK
jgi:hypothetical protein